MPADETPQRDLAAAQEPEEQKQHGLSRLADRGNRNRVQSAAPRASDQSDMDASRSDNSAFAYLVSRS